MKKFFFSSLLLIIFLIIIYISLNSNFRRSILSLSSGLINNYYSIMIRSNLGSERGISKSIKILESQIKITDFITTKQKNSFIDNIYFNLYTIEKNLGPEDDLLILSKIVKKLIAKDPNIYDALIWNAKIMSIEKKEEQMVYKQIDEAIKLSPASAKAYRFALDYSKEKANKNKVDKYCKNFHDSFLGSRNIKNNLSRFSESSLSRFAVQIKSNKKIKTYIVEGTSLNNIQEYIIDLEKPSSFSEFIFLSNFFPGILISISDIKLRDFNDKVINILPNDVFISSENSFFVKDQNIQKIFVNSFNDEKITFKFDRKFEGINQLKFKINFTKANITNKSNC